MIRRSVLPPLLILFCVVLLLLPALPRNHVLLPAHDLAFMSPWNSVLEPSSHQWNPLIWDALAQFYPWRVLYSRALHLGQLPLWNKNQFCGTPVYANAQSAIFYPLNLIFYFIDPARAFGFSAVLHLFLAGLFTFLLARSLRASTFGATVSGVVYALCAFNVTWLELPTLVNVAAWLPLTLLLTRIALVRRSWYLSLVAGSILGLVLLAGHLQVAFYVLLTTIIWGIWTAIELRRSVFRDLSKAEIPKPDAQRGISGVSGFERSGNPEAPPFLLPFARLALTVIIGFSLAAAQLLPTFELGGLSHRAGPAGATDYSLYISTGLPTMNLVTAFVPDFYGNPSKGTFWGLGNYTEYAMYVGVLPLILAIAALVFRRRDRQVVFFAILAGFALLVALGSPLAGALYYLVPGFKSTGSPARILVLYCFSMSILAGFGATTFTEGWPRQARRLTAGRVSAALLTLGVAGLGFLVTWLYAQLIIAAIPGVTAEQTSIGLYSVFIALGLFFVSAAILVWRTANMMRTATCATLILIVVIGDLLLFGSGFNPVAPAGAVYPMTPGVSFLQDVSEFERVMPINGSWGLSRIPPAVLPPNSATIYDLMDTQGYDSLFPGAYKDFARELLGKDPSPMANGNMILFGQYSNAAARYARYIVTHEPLRETSLDLVYEDEFLVYKNENALPRAEAMALEPNEPQPEVKWTRDVFNEVELRATSARGTRLILRDTNYPGWNAYTEIGPVAVAPVETIFRSVTLPAGSQTVTFKFEPESLRIGMYISLICLAALAACAVAWMGGRSGQ